jgi:hypothetical protein
VSESKNPSIESRKVSSVLDRTHEMIEEFDTKSVKAIDHMLRIWEISHIAPIKLVHNDIETIYVVPIRYEPPNTVVVDDSSYAVQYLYDNMKELRTAHKILAGLLAFAVEDMARSAAKKTFDGEEGYLKMRSARTEIEKFLERKYGSTREKTDSPSYSIYQ